MSPKLNQRLSTAMMYGWPTVEERQRVLAAAQEADAWEDLPDGIRKMVIGWEHKPRRTPVQIEPSKALARKIRKVRP